MIETSGHEIDPDDQHPDPISSEGTEPTSTNEATGNSEAEESDRRDDASESTDPLIAASETSEDDRKEIDAGKDEDVVTAETSEIDREKSEKEPLLPVPAARPVPQRSIFWPLVFGGLVAAVVGFIAGRGDQLEPFLPASMQRAQAELTPLEDAISALSATVEAQAARLEEFEKRPAVESDQPDLTGEIATLTKALGDLQAQLTELEARPVATATADNSADAAEIAALRESLDAQAARVESQQAALESQQETLDAQRTEMAALAEKADAAEDIARSEAAALLARAALTRVVTAVETGDTFTPALGDLEETLPVEIPDALRVAAETGVPTLSSLQGDFPQAARAALAAARAEIPEAEVEGLGGFLRRQLGARSIAPREGSDPDAVLSRAEAALQDGDLAKALAEIEGLPEVSRAAMQGWLDAATARQAAEDAAQALSDSLESN